MNDKRANSAIANESGYTGGAFDMTIPNDYRYADYERDMSTCADFVIAMKNNNVDECARILLEKPEVEYAFGRATAYAERNYGKAARS